MTTKLQAKAIKTEIAQLKKDNRTDSVQANKTTDALIREINKLKKEITKKDTEIYRQRARFEKREDQRNKRIAILEGRL